MTFRRLIYRTTIWLLWMPVTLFCAAGMFLCVLPFFLHTAYSWLVVALRDWADDTDYYSRHVEWLLLWDYP